MALHNKAPTNKLLFGLVAGLAFYSSVASLQLSCIGDNGKPVDWFIAYKLPHKVQNPLQDGYGYVYMDANSGGFVVSKYSAKDTRSAMGATLEPVYSNAKGMKESLAYMFYNDANPEGKEFFDYGHSKGDVAFNENGGFWLVHSVPKYPNSTHDGYDYPHSGTYYGQMFFCVNFNTSEFDKIGMQLRYNGPHIHDSNLPSSMEQQFPNIKSLVNGDFILDAPYNRSVHLISSGGKRLVHFAKNKNFGADLYAAFVAPSLKTPLLAETWQQGHGRTGSWCKGQFTVENILRLNIATDTQSFAFVNFEDHSKYVLSKTSANAVVCIGDINRMESQFKRGGGTLCTFDSSVWTAFRKFAVEIDSCNDYIMV
eukprot:Seg507.5 transcript_id=Seg507.5/GoldUCD/mRNA.D3Y31 product=Plancitoxin-1 protein_id=Seg507.5/GoldUCD/D3Y31